MSNENENQFVEVEETKTEPTKKESKKFGKIGIVAVAVLALVLVVLNAPKIGNAAVKLFTSPAGYFQHVLKNSSDEVAEQFAKGYGMGLESLDKADDLRSEAEFSISVGEDVRDMLEDETDIDFGWMEKASLLVNSDMTKDAYKFDMGLVLNEERLISLIMLANMSDKMAYLQVPELNETYLGVDLETLFDEMDLDTDDMNEVTELYEKLVEALPKDAKVEKLLKRYFDLAISCVEDVEQSKEEVKVGEISNKYTVLEATIDEETVKAMLEAVIPELKDDKDVKEIIYNVTDVLCEVLELEDELDADDVYDEFVETLEDLEDELDDLEDEDFEFVLELYVDNEGKIKGWVVEVEEEDVEISSFIVTKGSKFAYELEGKVDGVKAVLEGTGKLGLSTLNGEFKVKAAGLKIIDFTLDDVKLKDLKDGYFNGTISVSLGSSLTSMLEEEMGDEFPFDLEDLVLELTAKCDKDESDVTVSLYEKDDLLVAVTTANKIGKAGSIKYPKDKEVAMIEDEDDLMDWVQDIDVDEFVESLEDVFGEEFVEFLEDVMSGDVDLPSFGGYEEDYWYEDDYYYEDWY